LANRVKPSVKYRDRSPKCIWAPCAQLYSFAEILIRFRMVKFLDPFLNRIKIS
jgi:hypothetical protein